MYPLLLLTLSSVLMAEETYNFYVLGLSHHGTWDSPGEPNERNPGLGVGWSENLQDPADPVRVSGEMAIVGYLDSYNELALGFAVALHLQGDVGRFVPECGLGTMLLKGSGHAGIVPVWYAGLGYRVEDVTVFVEGSYAPTIQLSAVWLKFSKPVN